MTGLEKITDKIFEQSKNNCDNILAKANAQVKTIIQDARTEGNRLAENIVEKAQAQADKRCSIAKSTAESITRNRYLEIRNAILNDIISAAYLDIEKLSDEKYFDILIALLKKNIRQGKCIMYLNGFDLSRLPDDFEKKIKETAGSEGSVEISSTAVDIENGFILDYGSISVNCTLRAVFDENMDDLKDMLNKELFN